MRSRVALITNVCEYAGPGALEALITDGLDVIAHDRQFADAGIVETFRDRYPDVLVTGLTDADELASLALDERGGVDVLVSNDVVARSRYRLADATVELFRSTLDALVVWPFRLAQLLAPQMQERGAGSMIFITSAAAARTGEGSLMYGAARAATTSMAMALAKELGPFGIQVNSIGPNFFENPTYFPPGRVEGNRALQSVIATQVPLRRLGRQDEMGALISLLASGKALPMTGQFISFSGGWYP
jgi:NAD(P)-dependent dehydrogenase (short-subunit alcohol dehydrogenase family)